jgi:hypothetical protein
MEIRNMGNDSNPAKVDKKTRGRNSLVHGIYSKELVLPWESRDDFERLHADLKFEFCPNGRSEDEAVLDLATLHWQKRTLWRLRQSAILKDRFTEDIVRTKKKSWAGIRKALRERAADERTMVGSLESTMSKLASRMQRVQEKIEASSDRDQLKNLETNLSALTSAMAEQVLPLVQAVRAVPNPEQSFDMAYAPESLEKLYHLESILDARIAKVLSRLVGLKEFKRTPAGGNGAALVDGTTQLHRTK